MSLQESAAYLTEAVVASHVSMAQTNRQTDRETERHTDREG